MPAVLKYTKAQYEAKISELENLLGQLKDHREKMATLKDQMFNFWDDPNARKAGEALAVQPDTGVPAPRGNAQCQCDGCRL